MARAGALGFGIFMFIIAGVGFVFPITDEGHSFPVYNDLCASGTGQILQFFGGSDAQKTCMQVKYITYGIYGFGLIGLILIIVGAAVPGKKRTYICEHCNFATETEAQMINHKNQNHLKKASPYVCEHCSFIGRTEGELLDHYDDNHPKEKKW